MASVAAPWLHIELACRHPYVSVSAAGAAMSGCFFGSLPLSTAHVLLLSCAKSLYINHLGGFISRKMMHEHGF